MTLESEHNGSGQDSPGFPLQQLVADISSRFANVDEHDFDATVECFLARLGEFFDQDRSYIFRFSPDLVWMDNTHEWCAAGVASQKNRSRKLAVDKMPWLLARMLESRPLQISDIEALPPEAAPEQEEFRAQEIKSLVCLPMLDAQGSLLGFLGFDSVTGQFIWPYHQLRMLQVVAEIIAGAINRRETQRALRESEARLADILANVSDAVWSVSWPDMELLFASPAAESISGYPVAAFSANPGLWVELLHPDDRHLVEVIMEQLRSGMAVDLEYRIIRRDGTLAWVRDKRRVVVDDQGRPHRVDGSVSDITRQKKASEALRVLAESDNQQQNNILAFLVREIAASQGKRLALIAEVGTRHPVVAHTVAVCSEGRLVDNFSYDLVGTPCGDVVSRGVCFYPRDVTHFFPNDRLLVEMNVESYWGTPLRASTGEVIGLLAIIDDLPMAEDPQNTPLLKSFAVRAAAEIERRQGEVKREHMLAALTRSNREMARLTEVMAHNLQEPARRVVTYAQRLRKNVDPLAIDADEQLSLDYIEAEARRLRNLVKDIQQYLVADASISEDSGSADVREVIKAESKCLAPRLAKAGGRIEVGELPPAPLDRRHLRQLLAVLLDNALKHAPQHQPLLIRISGESDPERVRYRIEDNGLGIPASQRERVFSLFERLESTEEGTGLGLAIARRIVDSRGGEIRIEQSELGGAAIVFELPRAKEEA